ncbi:sodium/hydrogen exchanger 2 [Zea mays]|nr:sodium/hydrogen exchanger 2 [Zea mays]|eukprot:XP_008664117.1 sodium/hydrogen exchanger 2 [Zea mays]
MLREVSLTNATFNSQLISIGALGLISRLNIGALELGDYLALGAIFSATDSICTLQVLSQDKTPFLYNHVFGEGVVNDATSVVLFNAIQNFDPRNISGAKLLNFIGSFLYLFGSSTILGVASGLLSAYTIKKLYFGRHSTDREVSIMMLMAYLSCMLAELLDFSGILTVFFCGIVMSHYTWHNVTESSRVTTKHAFATLSFISEIFLFLYVGMDALDIEKWKIVDQTYRHTVSLFLSLHCSTRRSFF